MKRTIRIVLLVLVLLVITMFAIRFLSGDEDTWICDGNILVKHGNPYSDGSGLACYGGRLSTQSFLSSHPIPMQIGADFYTNNPMPAQYTCDGEGLFPPLEIDYIPDGAKSLALIVDDPDAPSGVRDHLLLANIPVNDYKSITISQDTFAQSIIGKNSRGEQKRGAPCPPNGEHKYVFTVYALSEMLEISAGFTKDSLISLMSGKIIEQTEIVGLYEKKK